MADAQSSRAGGLFVLIGGEPHTAWLPEEIERDQWGFMVTGNDVLCQGRRRGGRCQLVHRFLNEGRELTGACG